MFTLNLVDENIFMIVKKDALKGMFFKTLPIKVYGFIRVNILEKNNYGMSFMNIAQEVFDSNELLELIDEAKKLALSGRKYF